MIRGSGVQIPAPFLSFWGILLYTLFTDTMRGASFSFTIFITQILTTPRAHHLHYRLLLFHGHYLFMQGAAHRFREKRGDASLPLGKGKGIQGIGLFINLTPDAPLSFKGEGETIDPPQKRLDFDYRALFSGDALEDSKNCDYSALELDRLF